MECNKCGSNKIKLTLDSRGLPEARCEECGSLIKKMKAGEVVDYYEAKIADLAGSKIDIPSKSDEDDRRPCRYCTENYAILQGSMRQYRQFIPVQPNYCPVCGRKLKESDRKY